MGALTRTAGILAVLALIAGVSVATAPAAHAAANVTVTNPEGAATADPDYATEVTVRGSGFQSIPKGFGGVYVLFGWVDDPSDGSWRPSRGGVVGADFRYVPDSETQDNQGFQRFVAFPGSDTEGAAQAVMSADGSWSTSMVIPGAVFQSRDRSGSSSSVDCREVTCGIITIGAHGVKNANNETFTPVRFAAPGASGAAPAPEASTPATAPGDVRVGLASGSVRAGTSIVFTGQGFAPGEQVVAALDDGLTAVGPLTAGTRGEVAGALPVPREARAGTHVVSLTGAASGAIAEAEVTIESDAAAVVSAAADAQQVPQWAVLVLLVSIVIALILVIASAVTSVRRAHARRKKARAAASANASAADSAAQDATAQDATAESPDPAASDRARDAPAFDEGGDDSHTETHPVAPRESPGSTAPTEILTPAGRRQ